jgi:lipopolysaccharide transport system ATP-binding protein
MSDIVIQVENLSKYYRLGLVGTTTLEDDLHRSWAKLRGKPDPTLKLGQDGKKNGDGYIWALKDISFEVKQGEVLGIIGRNGSGKSTLLKILSRVTAPTTGKCRVKGRIASLLEVGTGFHPELTGRENIFLNGAILGMTKEEIKKKFDEIVAFAEVEKFIDTPVKRYSSGMYVRLAFAVAGHLEPEILVVDEVLAVGDAQFQKKCLGKLGNMATEGRTVLFVSHNMGAIRSLCGSAMWLDNGYMLKAGRTNEIISEYEESVTGLFTEFSCVAERDPVYIKGSGLHFSRVEALNSVEVHAERFKYGEVLVLNVSLGGQLMGGVFSAEFYIYNELGILVSVGASGPYHGEYFSNKVRRLRIEVGPLTITSGRYRIALSLMAGYERIDTWENAIAFTITDCQPFRMNWEISAYREGVCVLQQSFHPIE